MTTEETKVLAAIKEIVDRLSPNGETYTPEELAQEFAEEIVRLRQDTRLLLEEIDEALTGLGWHTDRGILQRVRAALANTGDDPRP